MGLCLRKYREKAGFGTRYVAQALGVSQPAYSRWENGLSWPTADKLPLIADFFGVEIIDLYPEDILPKQKGPNNGTKCTEHLQNCEDGCWTYPGTVGRGNRRVPGQRPGV